MKKAFLLILISITSIFPHKQHVHRYLTIEAYNLLKNHYGCDIPIMSQHVDIQGSIPPPWTSGMIATGAYREDEEDVIFHFSEPGKTRISVTHFWNADGGPDAPSYMDLGLWVEGPYPNAWQKITKYRNGFWDLDPQTDYIFKAPDGHKARLYDAVPNNIRIFQYHDLINLYKTGYVYLNVAAGHYYLQTDQGNVTQYIRPSGWWCLQLTDEMKNIIVWEILGRMCHLLQDMSVPAHAHVDPHGDDWEFGIHIGDDDYEKWISEENRYAVYNANNVGDFLNPYWYYNPNIDDPIFFLMYTTNQIADHFWSSGPINASGDDNYGQYLPPYECKCLP